MSLELALKAPITPEMVANVYGHCHLSDIRLGRDDERAAFMAIWALLAFEWADAMREEQRDRQTAKRTLGVSQIVDLNKVVYQETNK